MKFNLILVLTLMISSCSIIRERDIPPDEVQPLSDVGENELGSKAYHLLSNSSDSHSDWVNGNDVGDVESLAARSLARIRGVKDVKKSDIGNIVEVNAALSSYYRNVESNHYRSGNASPKQCLAFSGGGIRSAAVSIGVLQGLNEESYLKDIDVMSGVSGGSYAIGWYLTKRLSGISDSEVLSDDYISKSINPELLDLGLTFLGVVGSFMNVGGSMFPNGVDTSSLNTSYLVMLRESFGKSYGVKTADIRTLVENKKVPVPVIGMSAYPLKLRLYDDAFIDDENCFLDEVCDNFRIPNGRSLSEISESVAINDTYLEHTPFRHGVPGFGYTNINPTPGWDEYFDILAISGAAVDRVHDKGSADTLAGWFRLGGHLSLTLPNKYPLLGGFDKSLNGYRRQFFYISDGGFVDNLAIFPLILRRCESIIIIDSEYDPLWTFEGYQIIKKRLLSEHNIDFTVDDIDRIIDDAEYEEKDRLDGLADPADLTRDQACTTNKDFYDACAARGQIKMIFNGYADKAPISYDGAIKLEKIKISYIKLGIFGADNVSNYDDSIIEYIKECYANKSECFFPQEPTFHFDDITKSQVFKKEQFNNYKNLGKYLIKSYISKDSSVRKN